MLGKLFTWSLLGLAFTTCSEDKQWKLSNFSWQGEQKDFKGYRTQLWNLWFTDFFPFLGKEWTSFHWDWDSLPNLKYNLEKDQKLLRFVSFEKPGEWVALWLNTFENKKPKDSFKVWKWDGSDWKYELYDVYEWSHFVSGAWDTKVNLPSPKEGFESLPSSWPLLVFSGLSRSSLYLAGSWVPKWKNVWKNGKWNVEWKK